MLDFLIPLHPKVVHFPIALFLTALIFEMISWIFRKDQFHKTALYLFVFAALLSPLIVRTGMWEAERLHLNHPLLAEHSLMAQRLMWISLMSLPFLWLLKREYVKYFRITFVIVTLVTAGLVGYAGHLGGQMVYEYGVGVEV